MSQADEWSKVDLPNTAISTEQLDAEVRKMTELWDDYEAKKKISTEAHGLYDAQEALVLELLTQTKKSKYFVEGIGTVSKRVTYAVPTPKGNEQKQLLFDYISERHGTDALMGMLGINYQTLQAFVKAEKESDPLISIPGLEAPVAKEGLVLRAERK